MISISRHSGSFLGFDKRLEGHLLPTVASVHRLVVRAGNVPGNVAAGRQQHRLYRQLRTSARHLQPVFWYRTINTIPSGAMSHSLVAL